MIELLVVISVIAVIVAILLPALGNAKTQAMKARDLANIKGLETAHWLYITDNNGSLIDVGLGHGGVDNNPSGAFINTLQQYYGSRLLARSPADASPHWQDDGTPVPSSGGLFRQTSYGINNYLTRHAPTGRYATIDAVTNPSEIVHFLYMIETGPFAGADHTHTENWGTSLWPPSAASGQVQIDKFGGPAQDYQSVANWGFLDGHAQTLTFGDVYQTDADNKFNPGLQ